MHKEVEKYYSAVQQIFNTIVNNRGCQDKVTEHKLGRGSIFVADLSKTSGDLLFRWGRYC